MALAALCLLLVADTADGVPSGDLDRINALIASMLDSPRGQIREWSGPSGNRGQVTLGPAVDTVAGETCTSWQNCSEPCRNVDFTFVGQDVSGRSVDNRYRAYYCLWSSGWASARDVRATRRVLAERPEPPRTVTVRELRPPAPSMPPVADSGIAPSEAPAASPVRNALVRSIQRRLRGLHYHTGSETGQLDGPTLTALRLFLVDEGLEVGDMDRIATQDMVFIDSRLGEAGERGRRGNCAQPGRFVACGRVG